MTKGACCSLRKMGGRDAPPTLMADGPRCDQPPPRIAFAACRSFTGTDAPHHRADGEGPRRTVRLNGFCMEAFPVTNARFAAFTAATGYLTGAEQIGWAPFSPHPVGARCPVPAGPRPKAPAQACRTGWIIPWYRSALPMP